MYQRWIYTTSPEVLPLFDVCSEIFDLLVSFLYTGDYKPTHGWLDKYDDECSTLELQDDAAIKLCKHARLYSLGLKFQLPELQKLTVIKMRSEGPIALQSLLRIAQEVYNTIEEQAICSFRDFLKAEATRAFQKDQALTQKPWLANTLLKGGPLAVDLFQGLVDSAQRSGPFTTDEASTNPKYERR